MQHTPALALRSTAEHLDLASYNMYSIQRAEQKKGSAKRMANLLTLSSQIENNMPNPFEVNCCDVKHEAMGGQAMAAFGIHVVLALALMLFESLEYRGLHAALHYNRH
jgi:hypothetical protein